MLDLSTSWDRAYPIGAATVQALTRLLETAIPPTATPMQAVTGIQNGLRLRLLGAVEAISMGYASC